MCWNCPFELRWLKEYIHNPSYYHHQSGSIQLSHCCHIFPWLCVWDGCTIIFCHLLHIYPGNTGNLFPFLMFSLWYLQMIGYIMTCRSCVCLQITPSQYHHYADLSEGIELLKCLSGLCCRVCVYDKDNSLSYLIFNIWGCVSSAYPIPLWWSWECVLYLIIIIKPEVWIINHCLRLCHETIVCAVCHYVLVLMFMATMFTVISLLLFDDDWYLFVNAW